MDIIRTIGPYLFESLIHPAHYSEDIRGCIKRTFLNKNLNVINHKYFYYSLSSTISYLNAIHLKSYKNKYTAEFEAEVNKFLEWCNNSKNINFKNKEPIAYFSLGCGDGEKDIKIIQGLQSKFQCEIDYFPIDFSYFLLNMAVGKIKKIDGIGEIHPFNIDFDYMDDLMTEVKPMNKTAFFSLLGNIIGNYNEDSLLKKISSIMKPGDYLLIGHRIISDETAQTVSNEGDPGFLLQPLKYFNIDTLNENNIKTDFHYDNTLSAINDSKSSIVKYQYSQNDICRLTYSTRYTRNSFKTHITYKFNLQFIDQFYNNDDTIYSSILFEKTEDLQSLRKSCLNKLAEYLNSSTKSTDKIPIKHIHSNMQKNPIDDATFLEKICNCNNCLEIISLFKSKDTYKAYLNEIKLKEAK